MVIAPIGIFREKASATIFVIPVIAVSTGLYAWNDENHLAIYSSQTAVEVLSPKGVSDGRLVRVYHNVVRHHHVVKVF